MLKITSDCQTGRLEPSPQEGASMAIILHLTLTLQVKVTRNVAQCPLHHVTYAPTEFEVTTSKALGGEAFTRKYII